MKKITRRQFLAAAGVACVGAALAGCSDSTSTSASTAATSTAGAASTDTSSEEKPAMITIAIDNEPPSFDQGKQPGSGQSLYYNAVYQGLITVDVETGEIIPAAAESWDVSDDGTVYTFHMRDYAVWSDGAPVTAYDFEYSWLRVLDEATASQYSWYVQMFLVNGAAYTAGEVDASEVGVKALDEFTLEVTLVQPASYFLQALLSTIWMPVREDYVSQDPDEWLFDPATNMCNGPYKMKEYKIGEYMLMEKNELYWDTQEDTVQEIKYVFLPDPSTCYSAFQTGEVQGTLSLPATDITQIYATDDQLYLQNGLSFSFFRLNTRVDGLDNMLVRKAMSLGFDRAGYLEGTGATTATPAVGSVPGGIILDGKDFREAAGDHGLGTTAKIEEAKALLAEAGYPNGEGLPTYAIHCAETSVSSAEILQEQFKQNLGIQTTIAPVDSKLFFPMMVSGDYEIGFGGWGGDYEHPMTFLELFSSTASDNCTGWANEEYDALLAEARGTLDQAKQLDLLVQAETLLVDEAAIIPASFPLTYCMMSHSITGWHMTASKSVYCYKLAYV